MVAKMGGRYNNLNKSRVKDVRMVVTVAGVSVFDEGAKVTHEAAILSLSIFIVLQYNFYFMDSFRIGQGGDISYIF